jgi:hypothetical protein
MDVAEGVVTNENIRRNLKKTTERFYLLKEIFIINLAGFKNARFH